MWQEIIVGIIAIAALLYVGRYSRPPLCRSTAISYGKAP